MNDEEKMKWMFTEVYGELSGSCSLVIGENEDGKQVAQCVKDDNVCWEMTKEELLFDYITKHLD